MTILLHVIFYVCKVFHICRFPISKKAFLFVDNVGGAALSMYQLDCIIRCFVCFSNIRLSVRGRFCPVGKPVLFAVGKCCSMPAAGCKSGGCR